MQNRVAVAELGIYLLPQKTTDECFTSSKLSPLTSRSASKRCASRRRASIVSVKPSLLCGLLCLIPLAFTWCSQFSRKLNAMHANPKKLQLPPRTDRSTPSQSFCSVEKTKSTGERVILLIGNFRYFIGPHLLWITVSVSSLCCTVVRRSFSVGCV